MTAQTGRLWPRSLFNGLKWPGAFRCRFPGKFWSNSNRAFDLAAAYFVIGFMAVSGVHVAEAQTASSVPPAEQTPPYCKQSTLTGPAFLELLNTIIKHGDLTDIVFLQKTLATKLSPLSGGGQGLRKSLYGGNNVLGNPIHIAVFVEMTNEAINVRGTEVASVQFSGVSTVEGDPNFIRDCLKLTADDFVAYFGPFNLGGMGSALKYLNSPGKDDTKMEIGFLRYLSFDDPTPQREPAYMVQITQRK